MTSGRDLHWKVFQASATGTYHREAQSPCQDAAHHAVHSGVFVGVVCDGAGSASQGHRGARFIAQAVTELVVAQVAAQRWDPGGAALPELLQQARSRLEALARQEERGLRDFACTLVGCAAGASGGCFFHVGDGYAIELPAHGAGALSPPENGEYADETYFITEDSWREHVRVTPLAPIGPGEVLGLLSDGAAPFAVNRARDGFFRPFIDPVVRFLRAASESDGNRALLALLEDEKTHAITPDDKTLLLALAQ